MPDLDRDAHQSHFDIIAAEKAHRPLFAVEFDGPAHDKAVPAERDRARAELSERFQDPSLRISAILFGFSLFTIVRVPEGVDVLESVRRGGKTCHFVANV